MRKILILLVACSVLLAVTGAVAQPAQAFNRRANERTMLRLINHTRAAHHLHALRAQKALTRSALGHSRQMVACDYFSHSSAGGASYATRVLHSGYERSGYRSWSASEVLGFGEDLLGTPQAILKAWLKSKSHRALILGKRWRDVGVGGAWGSFCGVSGCVVYTVDLGRRTR
jgi:uncharacterized protein YkwD